MNLLLVDDEPSVLNALQRVLRSRDARLCVSTAPSGAAALDVLSKVPIDVVISDMRMPHMSGAQLLASVHEQYPATVRIVLSGQMDLAATFAAVPHAHQFLTKPCPTEELTRTLQSAAKLHELLTNATMRAAVGAVDALPANPATCVALRAAIAARGATTSDVAAIIETDVALAAKVLQLVNSAFFCAHSSSDVTSVPAAVSLLRLATIESLSASGLLFTAPTVSPERARRIEAVRAHASRCVAAARRIAPEMSAATSAALLCGVGRLVIAEACALSSRAREDRDGNADVSSDGGDDETIEAAERRLGVSHAMVGAYLLRMWGLPLVLVDAIAHHSSLRAQTTSAHLDVVVAVHVADAFARQQPLDEAQLAAIGKLDQARAWLDEVSRGGTAVQAA